jgi:hypothetical protein
VANTTQIDVPGVLLVSDAVGEVAARLEAAAGELRGVPWLAIQNSEACAGAVLAADDWITALTRAAADVRALSEALYFAGTGFRTSDDAAAGRLDAAAGEPS